MIAPHEVHGHGPTAALAARMTAMIPVIETARLRLRAPVLADFPAWAEIFCGPRAVHVGGPVSRNDAFTEFAAGVAMWLLRGHGPWAIEPIDGGEVLGFVLVGFEPGDREPEMGYLLRETAEGRGIAREAAAAVRDHAFGAMGLSTLVSYVAPANARSVRIAESLGARHDGEVDGCLVFRHPSPNPATVSP